MAKFVNYQKRGISLPPGCKDLMDVLARPRRQTKEQPISAFLPRIAIKEEHFPTGGLAQLGRHLSMMLQSREEFIVVSVTSQEFEFPFVFWHSMFDLSFFRNLHIRDAQREQAVRAFFKGQGMDFDEVREYQPGDEVRTIDWNVTARMNHPFVKKFVEERELTLMLVVDASGSGLFGSHAQSKRELAAEIASVLAFSAIRNNDKVGLILFTDEVEKFIPPRKGRRHVLRVIREVLFFEPRHRGTDLNGALEFLLRVTPHRAIAVVISDFIGSPAVAAGRRRGNLRPQMMLLESLAQASFARLRQANRRHDVVAVQIADRYELELPALGRLVLNDAETGEVVEINTGDERKRAAFAERQARAQADLARLFRSAGIDAIRLRTDQPYATELGKFFETREKRRLHG